jgi:hypothetical protein
MRRHTVRMAIPVFSLAVACGAVGHLTFPAERSMSYDVMETAAIDTSNTNVGIADPYLYGMSAEDINTTLDAMQALGVQDVRIVVFWAGVEPSQGVYDWSQLDLIVNAAAARDMGILADLDSTPSWAVVPGTPAISGPPADPSQFADFAGAVAARYAGKVSAYEVWNEPNSATFWSTGPDPAAYTELLQAAYPAIKTADPSALVIAAVAAPVVSFSNLTMDPVTFVSGMYEAGAHGYFDALSFHPYHYTLPFSQGDSVANSPLEQLEGMRQLMVQYGDGSKQIWATEYGEPSSVAGAQNQAAFISDFLYAWADQSYTGPAFVFVTRDTGSSGTENTFGIYQTDWTAKPAAQVIEDWLAGTIPTEPPPPPVVGDLQKLALILQQVVHLVQALVTIAATPVISVILNLFSPLAGAVSAASTPSVLSTALNGGATESETLSTGGNFEVTSAPASSERSTTTARRSTTTSARTRVASEVSTTTGAQPDATTSENQFSGADSEVTSDPASSERPTAVAHSSTATSDDTVTGSATSTTKEARTDATASSTGEQNSGEATDLSERERPVRPHAQTDSAVSRKPDSDGKSSTAYSGDTKILRGGVGGAGKTGAQGGQDDTSGSAGSTESAGSDGTSSP